MTERGKQVEEIVEDLALVHADIVVLAKAHNPSVVSPGWLCEHCAVEEAPTQFVHTPDFSLFDSERLQITVDQARVQIVGKKLNDIDLDNVAQIASQYVGALPHIPYAAIGFNYVWRWQGPDEQQPKMTLTICGKAIPSSLNAYSMTCGGILYGDASDHRMRALIELPTPGRLTFNFNCHFDVNEKAVELVIKTISSFRERMLISQDITDSLLAGGDS